MVVAKQAMLYRQRVPQGQAYVFYIDIRSAGKGYDEFVQRVMTDYQVVYLRGKVSKIYPEKDEKSSKVIVWGADTLKRPASRNCRRSGCAGYTHGTSMEPRLSLGIACTSAQTLMGSSTKPIPSCDRWKPSPLVYFWRVLVRVRRISPEAVSQASGAAAKVLQLFSHER